MIAAEGSKDRPSRTGACLVTGATGLIGSHLVRLLETTREVVATSRRGGQQILPLDFASAWSDTRLPGRIDAVVHLAQSAHYRDFPDRADDIFAVNTGSTAQLLRYAERAGASAFILASTGRVYTPGPEPLRESDPVPVNGSRGLYAASKLASEILAGAYAGSMAIVCLRFFAPYGPGQQGSMLIPRLVQAVQRNDAIRLHGERGFRLNPVHVDDVARAIEASLSLQGFHVINVAGPQVVDLRGLGEIIGRALGKPVRCEPDESAQGLDVVADIRKMSQLLGPPATRVDDGIARYVASANPRVG